MKAIKITIQILIVFIPYFIHFIIRFNPSAKAWQGMIWNIIMAVFIVVVTSNWADKFGKWFNSKLK